MARQSLSPASMTFLARTGLLLWLVGAGWVAPPTVPAAEIEMFSREGCPRCAEALRFLEDLARRKPQVRLVVHDVGRDLAARKRLERLADRARVGSVGVPAFLVGDRLVVGFAGRVTTGALLEALLEPGALPPADGVGEACVTGEETSCVEAEAAADAVELPFLGRLDVQALGLPLFTIALGLLDGFNPCAMWVLLFVLSLLVNMRERARMFLVGGTFVLVSGVVYFGFMAAWLNVFLFFGVARPAEIVLGVLAAVVGLLNLKDFFALGRGPSVGIPAAAKPGLYARVRRVLQAESLAGAIGGIAAVAVLVNVVELACTAGLPVLYTRILTLRELPPWQYYGYLAVYNLAYIADDAAILAVAVTTLTRRKLQEHAARWLKLASAVVMSGLGALLIVRPDWLA